MEMGKKFTKEQGEVQRFMVIKVKEFFFPFFAMLSEEKFLSKIKTSIGNEYYQLRTDRDSDAALFTDASRSMGKL